MARKVDPEKHEAKRRRIVDAAMACVARNGFHQTSIAQICAEAGVSSGSLFHYFKTKEDIIEAIADDERREIDAVFERIGSYDDLLAGLIEFFDDCLSLLDDAAYVKLEMEISAEAARSPRIADIFGQKDACLKAGLLHHLKLAAERGQIDPTLDIPATALWLMALIDGTVSRAALDPDFDPTAQSPVLHLLLKRALQPH